MPHKVVLVTGASSGIGKAVALRLHDLGHTVYGAARRVERMADLEERGVRTLSLDVSDAGSMQTAVKQVLDGSGRIDALVNNAGYGVYGAVEDVPLDEARAQFEVNVFGLAGMIQLVLPAMRAQRSGTIVNISSMGGRIHTPLGAWYHGSKFAVEALSDCLRLELAPFGVNVVVVQPGAIRTEWFDLTAAKLREISRDGVYAAQADVVADMLGPGRSAPSVVAATVARAIASRRPRTRYTVGFGAKPLIFLRRALPDRAYDAMMRRAARPPKR